MEEYMLPCLNKKYLGFECMGCGLQRSLVALFQGDFVKAFELYPAIYPLVLLGVMISLNYMVGVKYGSKIISVLAILSVTTIIVSYILKLTS